MPICPKCNQFYVYGLEHSCSGKKDKSFPCSACGGTGLIHVETGVPYGLDPPFTVRTYKCQSCGGTGRVSRLLP